MRNLLFLISFSLTGVLFSQPTITGFSPSNGTAGTTVTISGTGFNTTKTNNIVRLGGIKCSVTNASSTSLTVVLPNQITTEYFYVTDVPNTAICKSTKKFLAQTNNTPSSYSTSSFASKISVSAGATGGTLNTGFGLVDLDDDGDYDFALFENTNSSLNYISNTWTSGSFSSSNYSSSTLVSSAFSTTSCNATLLIDVDSDGDLDFYCARSASSGNYSKVYLNNTSTSVSANTTGTDITGMGFYGGNVRQADFNQDGFMDHVSSYTWFAHVSENKGTSTPAFTYYGLSNSTYGATANATPIDINNDGVFDVAMTGDGTTYGFKWAVNNTSPNAVSGSYSFSAIGTLSTPQAYSNLWEGDFNNDGKMDVMTFRNNSATIFRNTSSSTTSYGFTTNSQLSIGSLSVYAVQFADLNNDGLLDIIAGQNGTGGNAIYYYRNTTSSTGGTISFASGIKIIDGVGGTLHQIEVVDINEDGFWDIISKGNTSTNIEIYLNQSVNTSKYYAKSSGISALTTLTNWTTNNDGTGSNPSSFSSADTFVLSNSSNSTSFSIGSSDWTLTGATLIIPSGATLTVPTGRTLTLSGATISNSGTIDASSGNITITGTGNNTLNGTVNVGTLTTNTSSSLTVGASATLNVYTALNLTSIGTFTTNSNVYLKSNSSGTARLGAVSGTISGNINCELYVAGGYRKFRFLAHPFTSNQGLSILTDDIDITGTGGSNNGFTTTGTNNPSAFWYNPTNGDGANYDAGWTEFTSTTAGTGNNWAPGQGIIVMMRGSKGEGLTGGTYTPSAVTLDMSGTVNTGNVTVNLDYSGTGNSKGLNLLGNPYPSPIDVSGLVHGSASSSKINKTVYTRNSRQGSYRTDAISSGTAYSVPAYASFFLKTNASTSSVTFTENMKQSSSSISTFLGGGEENTPNFMRISALINNEQFDKVDFYFGNEYSDTFDNVNDAFKLTNDYFNFYSLTSDKSKVAIDFRNLDTTKLIPLGLGIAKNSIDTITLFFDANNSGAQLYLYDYLTQQKTNIITGGSYQINVDANSLETIGENRLVIGSQSALNALSNKLQKDWMLNIYPNPANDYVHIETYNSFGTVSASIKSISGSIMEEYPLDFSKNKVQRLDVSNLGTGIYLLELKDSKGRRIVKKFTK